ncbi:transposase [Allosphingosinicella vermicomposti]|uniref:transposase n=1 Tax=Allosphingosinicella vermicomposti TaxID=614671 RepID=UPI000D0FDA12|nr:transposase [Allosphingosinicella vermicomposti]
MPRVIHADSEEKIELGDLVDALKGGRFDPRDEDNFSSWGPLLKKLANNRTFLTDLVVGELKDRCDGQVTNNEYSSQVIILHRDSEFIVRANFWPALTDSVIKHSGTAPFLYDVAHDHNFSFLTVGYLGPGYWSDYYEFDYESAAGYDGEKVELKFIEKARLDQGKVMLYRAHKDVHRQLPADAMSMSINILEANPGVHYRDQYRFDLDSGAVSKIVNTLTIEPLLALSAHFGGDKGKELLDHYARFHPSARVQMMAVSAQASAAGDIDARLAVFEAAARGGNAYVAPMAAKRIKMLESGRNWLNTKPV